MTHPCYFCPETLPSSRKRKDHCMTKHRTLTVMCPWCQRDTTFRRCMDLKIHVHKVHPAVDVSALTEVNCCWLATQPEDYGKIIVWPSSPSKAGRMFMTLMRKRAANGSRSCEAWESGWREASGDTCDSDSDSDSVISLHALDDFETVSIPTSFKVHDLKINLLTATIIFNVMDYHMWKWIKLEIEMGPGTTEAILRNMGRLRANPPKTLSPTHDPESVPVSQVKELTTCLSRELTAPIPLSSERGIWFWVEPYIPVSKGPEIDCYTPSKVCKVVVAPEDSPIYVPTKIRKVVVAPETLTTPEISNLTPKVQNLEERAKIILQRGSMPMVPPGRRAWTRREQPLKVGDNNIVWPPKGWTTMSPDVKLLMWKHAALTMQLSITGHHLDRDTLMARFNFLGLPGSRNPPLTSTSLARLREGNFHHLQDIARGKAVQDESATVLDMLEATLSHRDTSLDFILDQLVQVPLNLDVLEYKD